MADLSPEARRRLFYTRSSRVRLPFVRRYLGYLRAGLRGQLSLSETAEAYYFLARFGWWNRSRMAEDLLGLFRYRKTGRT
jgi:hypothetical protein